MRMYKQAGIAEDADGGQLSDVGTRRSAAELNAVPLRHDDDDAVVTNVMRRERRGERKEQSRWGATHRR